MKQSREDDSLFVDVGECWILFAKDESKECASGHVVGCHGRCVLLDIGESGLRQRSIGDDYACNRSSGQRCLRGHCFR